MFSSIGWFADSDLFVYPDCTKEEPSAGTKFLVCTHIVAPINLILIIQSFTFLGYINNAS